MPVRKAVVRVPLIESRILLVRGRKVIIDSDLAVFYGVSTKRLNEQVKRNARRFPKDFMFRLTRAERSEVVADCDHLGKLKYSKSLPYAFTEHGAIMVASVLSTSRAVEVSVFIVRAFMSLRVAVGQHRELARQITRLEERIAEHDQQILSLVRAIKKIAAPDTLPKKRRIGFQET